MTELKTKMEQLDSLLVADFPFEGKVVQVDSKMVINDAFKLLNKNNILSCPVYDSEAGKYLGFFDIVEAMSLVYSVDALLDTIPASLMKDNLENTLEDPEGSIGAGSPVSILFEDDSVSDMAPWQPVSEKDTLSTVIKLLGSGLRRVPVVDSNGQVIKIISQSGVTQELAKILEKSKESGTQIPSLFSKTPVSLNLGLGKVVSIRENEPAREAFKKILETGYSAVAVLDEKDALFTCISTKDVRQFDTVEEAALQRALARKKEESEKNGEAKSPHDEALRRHAALMDLPATDFVAHARQSKVEKKDRPSVVCAEPNSTIASIIGKLAVAKVHRVFLCDNNRTPVGVVSVSDICKLLLETLES